MAFSISVEITIISRTDLQFSVLINGTCEMLIKKRDEQQVFACTKGGSLVYIIDIVPLTGAKASIHIPKRYKQPVTIEVYGEAATGLKPKIL